MDIVETYECRCKPGFRWKTRSSFRAHYKSNRHTNMETQEQELENRKTVTRLQIELDKEKTKNKVLKKLYLELLLLYNTSAVGTCFDASPTVEPVG